MKYDGEQLPESVSHLIIGTVLITWIALFIWFLGTLVYFIID